MGEGRSHVRLFSDVASRVDDPYLARAAALAEQARGCTAPNPLVGCVIVNDGHIVGEGFHPRAGEPHAEVFALRQAGEAARGADVYVTLEPCSHFGRTPPCAAALVDAGVARVVVGMPDPSAEARGGAEILRDAGVDVLFSADPVPFRELNEGWLLRVGTGRPLVTVKLGISLDAHGSFERGRRAAITGPSGAAVTRMLRQRAEAVAVSAATVIADDPALTVREEDGSLAPEQPTRAVLVRDALPPADAGVFVDGLASTLVIVTAHGPLAGSRKFSDTPVLTAAGDDTSALMRALGDAGFSEVLVEAGPRLFSAMWEQGAIDRLVTVVAGGCAGAQAPPLYVGAPDRAGDALVTRMAPCETGIVEDVCVTVWSPRAQPGEWERGN
jgi:diaminohydroxyphosphoribosylaminopyrimidine deaminase / 5-amino-6-(5-phosphoribosylamino)uracil reductase